MSEVIADTAVAVEPAPTTEPAAPTSAPEATENKVELTPEQVQDQELSAIFRKDNPDREPDGRYAAKEKPPEAEKPVEIPPMPSSWAKANEEVWQEMTPRAREMVLKREADGEKGVAALKSQYEVYKSLEAAIKPHAPLLAKMGKTPEQGVIGLIEVHQKLSGPDKYRTILEIANDYGINLPQMFGPQGQRPGQNSFIDQLVAKVNYLEAERNADKQAQVQRLESDLGAQIEAFSKDAKNEHFETLKPTMAQLLVSGVADGLEDAYSKASLLNPDIRAKIEAKTKASLEEKVRAEAAKKVAAINVKSSPVSSGSPKPLDDQLSAIWRKNHQASS